MRSLFYLVFFYCGVVNAGDLKLTDDAVAIDNEILFDFHLTGKVTATPTQIFADSIALEYTSTKRGVVSQPVLFSTSIILESADAVCKAFGGKWHNYFDALDLGANGDYVITAKPTRRENKVVDFDFVKFASISKISKIVCAK